MIGDDGVSHSEGAVADGLRGLVEENMNEFLSYVDQDYDEDTNFELDLKSFRDAGVMTSNEGFVLRFGTAEYQVTVIRSK